MKKDYTVRTAYEFTQYDKVIVVSNFIYSNKIVNYTFTSYGKEDITSSDVGMWKIKQLKNQL